MNPPSIQPSNQQNPSNHPTVSPGETPCFSLHVGWPLGDFEGHQLCSKVLEILEIMGFCFSFWQSECRKFPKFPYFFPTAVLIWKWWCLRIFWAAFFESGGASSGLKARINSWNQDASDTNHPALIWGSRNSLLVDTSWNRLLNQALKTGDNWNLLLESWFKWQTTFGKETCSIHNIFWAFGESDLGKTRLEFGHGTNRLTTGPCCCTCGFPTAAFMTLMTSSTSILARSAGCPGCPASGCSRHQQLRFCGQIFMHTSTVNSMQQV